MTIQIPVWLIWAAGVLVGIPLVVRAAFFLDDFNRAHPRERMSSERFLYVVPLLSLLSVLLSVVAFLVRWVDGAVIGLAIALFCFGALGFLVSATVRAWAYLKRRYMGSGAST